MRRIFLLLSILTGIAWADFSYPSRRPNSGTVGSEHIQYQWNTKLVERLKLIASNSGPLDTQPTLIVEFTQRLGGFHECVISTFDGRDCWAGTGSYIEVALENALKSYKNRHNQVGK